MSERDEYGKHQWMYELADNIPTQLEAALVGDCRKIPFFIREAKVPEFEKRSKKIRDGRLLGGEKCMLAIPVVLPNLLIDGPNGRKDSVGVARMFLVADSKLDAVGSYRINCAGSAAESIIEDSRLKLILVDDLYDRQEVALNVDDCVGLLEEIRKVMPVISRLNSEGKAGFANDLLESLYLTAINNLVIGGAHFLLTSGFDAKETAEYCNNMITR